MIKYVCYKIAKAQISGLLYTIGEIFKKKFDGIMVLLNVVPFAWFLLPCSAFYLILMHETMLE